MIPKDRFSKKTLELPAVNSRGRELRSFERTNRELIQKNRRELRMITQQLTTLADQIPDSKLQYEVFTGLLPTAKAIDRDEIPDSVPAELRKLSFFADTIGMRLTGNEVQVSIALIKKIIDGILTDIPIR